MGEVREPDPSRTAPVPLHQKVAALLRRARRCTGALSAHWGAPLGASFAQPCACAVDIRRGPCGGGFAGCRVMRAGKGWQRRLAQCWPGMLGTDATHTVEDAHEGKDVLTDVRKTTSSVRPYQAIFVGDLWDIETTERLPESWDSVWAISQKCVRNDSFPQGLTNRYAASIGSNSTDLGPKPRHFGPKSGLGSTVCGHQARPSLGAGFDRIGGKTWPDSAKIGPTSIDVEPTWAKFVWVSSKIGAMRGCLTMFVAERGLSHAVCIELRTV